VQELVIKLEANTEELAYDGSRKQHDFWVFVCNKMARNIYREINLWYKLLLKQYVKANC